MHRALTSLTDTDACAYLMSTIFHLAILPFEEPYDTVHCQIFEHHVLDPPVQMTRPGFDAEAGHRLRSANLLQQLNV
jgi:hypothetical protein